MWPEWYGPGGRGCASRDLTARCGPGLPKGWVAVEDSTPVGTVALALSSYGAVAVGDLWLVGLSTAPRWRGRGLGNALIGAVEAAAHGTLCTTAREAGPIFARRCLRVQRALEVGWQAR